MNPFTQPSPHWFYRLLQACCVGLTMQAVLMIADWINIEIFSAMAFAGLIIIADQWTKSANKRFGLRENAPFLVMLVIVSVALTALCNYLHMPLSGCPGIILFIMGCYYAATPCASDETIKNAE